MNRSGRSLILLRPLYWHSCRCVRLSMSSGEACVGVDVVLLSHCYRLYRDAVKVLLDQMPYGISEESVAK